MAIINFIKLYWREILEVAAVLVSIIICCIKKKPVQVVDTLKETIIRLLPYCINQAEGAPKGEKLSRCVSILSQVLGDMGINLNEDYTKFALEQVEIILSTPQKKGVTSDEK